LAVSEGSYVQLHNSRVLNNVAEKGGGGLKLATAGFVKMNSSTVAGNIAHFGGFADMKKGQLLATSSTFESNLGSESAGVIYVRLSFEVRFVMCHFRANTATSIVGGGVLYSDSPSSVLFELSVFELNRAIKGEGGVSLTNFEAVVNYAQCHFQNNSAFHNGGSITLHNAQSRITSSTFVANFVRYSAAGGGSVALADGAVALLADCSFSQHYGDFGSAIRLQDSRLNFAASQIKDNIAKKGAVFASGGSVVQLQGISFSRNTATITAPYVVSSGAGIFIDDANVTCEDCSFNSNMAPNGTGAAAFVGIRGKFNAKSSVFSKNSASAAGGALHFAGKEPGQLTSCVLEGNTARSGGAVQVNGKAACAFVECTLQSNMATDEGGAIAADPLSTATLFSPRFLNNTAQVYGGAAFFANTSNVLISGAVIVAGNRANHAGGGFFWASRTALPIEAAWVLKGNWAQYYGQDVASDVSRVVPRMSTFRSGSTIDDTPQAVIKDFYDQIVRSPIIGTGVECDVKSGATVLSGNRIEFTTNGTVRWDSLRLIGDAGETYPTTFTCTWQRMSSGRIIALSSSDSQLALATECLRGEYSWTGQNVTRCAQCKAGTYAVEVTDECSPCPRGARCDGEDHMMPLLGYWEPQHNTSEIYSCVMPLGCLGGESSECLVGYEGTVCAVCSEGYTKVATGCAQCSMRNGDITVIGPMLFIGLTLGLAGVAYLLITKAEARSHAEDIKQEEMINPLCRPDVSSPVTNPQELDLEMVDPPSIDPPSFKTNSFDAEQGSDTNRSDDNSQDSAAYSNADTDTTMLKSNVSRSDSSSIETMDTNEPTEEKPSEEELPESWEDLTRQLGGYLLIVVGHLQLIGLFCIAMPRIPWPTAMRMTAEINSVLTLNLLSIVPVGCIDTSLSYYDHFCFAMMLPIVIFTFSTIWAKIAMYFADPFCIERYKKIKNRQLQIIVYSLYFMYPYLCITILQLFNCRHIDGVELLASDVRLQCFNDTWWSYAYAGFFGILAYILGIPAFFTLQLSRNQHKLRSDGDVKQRFGLLYLVYQKNKWYAEAIEMSRKCVLVGPIMFFKPDSAIQVGSAACLAYCFLIYHFKTHPFLDFTINKAYTSSSTAIVLTLVCAMILKAYECASGSLQDTQNNSWEQWGFFYALALVNGYSILTHSIGIATAIYKLKNLEKRQTNTFPWLTKPTHCTVHRDTQGQTGRRRHYE